MTCRHKAIELMSDSRSDSGRDDITVVQDVLKEIAQTQQVDLNAKKRFKSRSLLAVSPNRY